MLTLQQLKIWVSVLPACAHLGALLLKVNLIELKPYAPPMDPQDWRAQLTADGRRRIINLLLVCFKKHSPCFAQEGELERTVVRFEEDVYSAASSKIDYQRKISVKCLSFESKTQSEMAYSLQIGAANASRNSSDLASASHIVLDDWRARVLPGSRERLTNKILETFKMHVPFSGQEELQKLEGSAVRFEQRTFSTATSEFEYLERISSKLLALPGAVSEWSAANSLTAKLSELGINN